MWRTGDGRRGISRTARCMFMHLLVAIAPLAGPGGTRAVVDQLRPISILRL